MADRAHQIYEKTTHDAVYVTASTGYLAYRLTGNRIDTAASYIGTWPIDMDKWDWTDEDMMFDFLNLPRTSLFKLVKPGGILGNVTEEAAAATGLPKGLPVIATANDKAVEALGAGLKTGPDLLLSLGTYTTPMLQGNENHPFGTTRYYWTNFADVPDEYLYESNGVYRGMWTVSWFAKQFQGIGNATHESTLDVLTREAATVLPGSDGLLTILDWQPAADRPFRKGAFIGLDERHNRGHMFRSILEGLAFNLLDYSTAMLKKLDRKVDRLVVTGGGVQNDIFMQLIADIFNLPAQRNVITDAAGLGAAINAAVGIGEYRMYDEAIAAMVKPADSFAPQANAVAQYAKVYEKYKNLHQLTDPVFKDLQTINGVAERGKVGLNQILKFDPEDMQLTVQAGVPLKQAEDWLNEKGYTTGHLPQSQPLADFGGLVATRSIGQLSTLYGGIEDMVVGLEAVMPDGRIVRIKNVPRRSVVPNIRHVFIGNEGSLAFITEVTVKLVPYLPDTYHYLAYTVDTMREGFHLLRDIVATGYRPSVIRLYDAQDWSQFYPKHAEKPVLIFRTEGPQPLSDATAGAIKSMVEASDQTQPYEPLDEIIDWFKHLTWTQKEVDAEVNQLEKTPLVGFTTEVAANWHEIVNIFEAVTARVKKEIPNLCGIGGHSSHSYVNGTNLYFVYAFIDAEDDPAGEMARYHDPINKIIVEETLKRGGTMSHHHGVGKARAPFIKEEYGSSYWVLKTLLKSFDPKNTMNAGNIIPLEFWDEPD
ncbi:FAD-binding protein [Lacticaseibacillus zeae]|uniref:FAD-binding protein n=1 Tax=Lacticaseibacillus zeae TaxID=57037 RepID=UPI0014853F3C|nr:FAD-binding protein [Lacticaseibacillus zeae]